MDKLIKTLSGHSGSQVFLMEDTKRHRRYIRKVFNVERNVERLIALDEQDYPVPKIYDYKGDVLDMEYLHGLDMQTFLLHNPSMPLIDFIMNLLDKLESTVIGDKDYTETYHEKLNWLPDDFLFTKEQLIEKLPKVLPQTVYHGDLTLENILYTNEGFKLIDPVTIEYDSYVFDVAKLRQDLDCKWFLRNSDARLDTELQNIEDYIAGGWPEILNDYLTILMLLRVLKHCEPGDDNYIFLMKEIERLWK
jgi:RIO-like serine/threonine protein kinase